MDNSNKTKRNKYLNGMHIHEIKPVRFGGNPTDPNNKVIITRKEHAKLVVWWNRKIQEIKNQRKV